MFNFKFCLVLGNDLIMQMSMITMKNKTMT